MRSIERNDGEKAPSNQSPNIPAHFPLEDKIRIWDQHNRKNADLAHQVNEMICYSAELEHTMKRQPMALRAHIARHGDNEMAETIREGIEGWKAVETFLNSDSKKIFELYRKNLEYLNDGEFDAHKAWVLAMRDFEKPIKEAFGQFASVLSSLSSQGYANSQFESPGQRRRAAMVRAEYNEALNSKRGRSPF